MAYVSSMPDEVNGYKLHERIGSGGMGEVYKAYNPSLHRWAAIKILHQEVHAERFRNEAYIQASVAHPNIARLYEFSKIGNRDCIVMEYVEGESLDDMQRRKGKLTAEETRNIISQLASALSYLHKKEIIHRDIKPQNIKVQPDGVVKMLDFGIAKHKLSPKLTQAGFVVGTMEYLAPEQLANNPELKSDIWALGVLCYELVTGYLPFESASMPGLQDKIRNGSFTDPEILVPDIPSNLCNIIDKCLRVNPSSRASANEITGLLAVKQGKKKLDDTGFNLQKFIEKQKLWLAAGVGIIALILLAALFKGNNNTPKTIKDKTEQTGNEQQNDVQPDDLIQENHGLLISTPGIDDAYLIFPNGEKKPLPYQIKGKNGDSYELTIHADGYIDKKVQVEISPRRRGFEYNLEKSGN